jgi:hypothetical protein
MAGKVIGDEAAAKMVSDFVENSDWIDFAKFFLSMDNTKIKRLMPNICLILSRHSMA